MYVSMPSLTSKLVEPNYAVIGLAVDYYHKLQSYILCMLRNLTVGRHHILNRWQRNGVFSTLTLMNLVLKYVWHISYIFSSRYCDLIVVGLEKCATYSLV